MIHREHKDRLFSFLFGSEQHKEWTLSLYNAVNGSAYDNPSDITITTIGEVIYMGMKNDVSFLISDILNIYEQQSTFNPNMPIRMFMYAGRLYDKYIHMNRKNIYSSSLVHLPAPRMVVFYNGLDGSDDTILKLSDAFALEEPSATNIHHTEYDIEVSVRMINVNYGHNQSLMEQCRPLAEYAWLIDRIRTNTVSMEIEEAVDNALKEMPDSFQIRTVLLANKAEVKNMCITEYNESETMLMFKEEGRKEGRKEGQIEGRKEAEAMFKKLMSLLLAKGLTEDAKKASVDKDFRIALYKEYGIL